MEKENNKNESKKENTETISISYNAIYKIATVIIITLITVMAFSGFTYTSASPNIAGNIVAGSSANAQIVKMHVEGSQYVFEPSSVKLGSSVKLVADVANMPGCSKGIISPELGIKKTFTSADNAVEFTPAKAGTFYIACSMNMYKGTLTVLEADGTKSNYVQKPATGGMTCGSSGGGCGCGG